MGLISPNKEKHYIYFDKIPRKQILQKFWSLVLASGWASLEKDLPDKRSKIQVKLKDFFEIAQKDGSTTYGDNINVQFQKQYTMGFDTGIWRNSDLDLSENAMQVFNGYMTPREYLTRFACNLFEYVIDVGYIHPLYETCKYAIENKKKELVKEDFYEILPLTSHEGNSEAEYKQHINMFINYLKATNIFDTVSNGIKFKKEFQPEIVLNFCNLEYKNGNQYETQTFFKSNENYSKYISKPLPKQYYEIIKSLYCEDSKNSEWNFNKNEYIIGGKNKIYYGAPGTGKSYKVDKTYKGYRRVTFHPEYTYFDFIGGLRPVQDVKTDTIKYEFVPGPFTDALIEAIFESNKEHGIIIEELNRANTAAVFGDIFQLLDRDDEGNSKYSITNKEIKDYINKTKGVNIDELIIPSNFSIIATMNSADQGVNVLDSAFKRRWQFEYIPINFKDPKLPSIKVAGFNIPWNEFGEKLNEFLSDKGIDEDKLIGQRFITEKEMLDEQLIASKLLIYLWDDVFRYNRKVIFKEHRVFSKLIEDYKQNGIKCFVPTLEEELYKLLDKEDQYRVDDVNVNKESSSIDEEFNDD